MQRRKQRSRFDFERAVRNLHDAPGDSHAMQFFEGERFEDEQVEGAL